jgi:hypothetical protein
LNATLTRTERILDLYSPFAGWQGHHHGAARTLLNTPLRIAPSDAKIPMTLMWIKWPASQSAIVASGGHNMNEQIRDVDPVPSWLVVRYIAVATELERMHGAIFATEFLHDVGITPGFDSGDSETSHSFYLCSRADFAA